MRQLDFVHISSAGLGGDGGTIAIDEDRRRIRSLVMKDFRRKERQRRQQQRSTKAYFGDGTSTGSESDEKANEIAQRKPTPTESPTLQLRATVSAPPVWRHSFGSRMAEAWFPAGHRDSALRNIAYTYDTLNSGPIVSIQDALSLLHAGSATKIDRVLLEARKRYLHVITLLRQEVSKKVQDVPVAQLGFLAMACLMCETYSAIACKSSLITWQRQVLGISALISPFQPTRFAFAMESFLFQQIRVAQLIHSLFERRPFPSSLAIHALPTHEDRLHSLLELAFQVPGILETVDSTIVEGFEGSQDDLLRRVNTLEIALRSWLAACSLSDTGRVALINNLVVGHNRELAHPHDSRNALFNLTCETLCRICHLLVIESLGQLDGQRPRRASSYPVSTKCANDLCRAMIMLEEAAGTPICKARVMSAPLHFLSGFYKRHEDGAGLRWCYKTKATLQREAPYLHWDALLPWCLLTLNEIPYYDVDPYA